MNKYFEKMSFDLELYDIISKYVKNVYDAFEIEEVAEGLLAEINAQTKNMRVGTPRGVLTALCSGTS